MDMGSCDALTSAARGFTLTRSANRKTLPSECDRANELRKGIREAIDRLAKAVDGVRSSDTFRACLDTQARFHDHSWPNCWMIFSQRPDPTRVAGFRTWLTLGRHARTGENGVAIFAPMQFKKDV